MQSFFDFNINYECWLNYYNKRKDADLKIAWHKDLFQPHPIQTDYFNCGIFTIMYIQQYIINSKIDFSTDPKFLFSCRHVVANKIKEFFGRDKFLVNLVKRSIWSIFEIRIIIYFSDQFQILNWYIL